MNTLISASAGSGKTYALTTKYLRLLRDGQPARNAAGGDVHAQGRRGDL